MLLTAKRSHRTCTYEVVDQGASSRVKTLPKNLIARVPCRTFSEQRFRRPALARAVRAALAMGTTESSRGRRERSPKQEYLDQVLKCVLMRGGRGGLYRRGGASDSTNLDTVIGFDERQLLVNHCHQLLVTVKIMILQSSLSTFIVSVLMLSTAKHSLISAHPVAPHRTAPHLHVTSGLNLPCSLQSLLFW